METLEFIISNANAVSTNVPLRELRTKEKNNLDRLHRRKKAHYYSKWWRINWKSALRSGRNNGIILINSATYWNKEIDKGYEYKNDKIYPLQNAGS